MTNKWYTVYWGSWTEPSGVCSYDFGRYCFGTYNKAQAFDAAKKTANKLDVEVTVSEEYGSVHVGGLVQNFYKVYPEKQSGTA